MLLKLISVHLKIIFKVKPTHKMIALSQADKRLKAKIHKEYLQIINKFQEIKKWTKNMDRLFPGGGREGGKEYSQIPKISHKKISNFIIIREMQFKYTMRFLRLANTLVQH